MKFKIKFSEYNFYLKEYVVHEEYFVAKNKDHAIHKCKEEYGDSIKIFSVI